MGPIYILLYIHTVQGWGKPPSQVPNTREFAALHFLVLFVQFCLPGFEPWPIGIRSQFGSTTLKSNSHCSSFNIAPHTQLRVCLYAVFLFLFEFSAILFSDAILTDNILLLCRVKNRNLKKLTSSAIIWPLLWVRRNVTDCTYYIHSADPDPAISSVRIWIRIHAVSLFFLYFYLFLK